LVKELTACGLLRKVVRRHFESHNELLAAAGFPPTVRRARGPHKLEDLFAEFRRLHIELGHPPRRGEYEAQGIFSSEPLLKLFGSWPEVTAAYDAWTSHPPAVPSSAAPVVDTAPALRTETHALGAPRPKTQPIYDKLAEQPICGRPLNYLSMLHEPTNEQGVVLLFGMMAEKLGFLIDNVRTGFPDCDAKRRVGPNEFQRIRIEFEYLSSRFNHPEEGCDLVVCWKHDTDKLKVEVLELAKLIAA
jgi:hypothetical protein